MNIYEEKIRWGQRTLVSKKIIPRDLPVYDLWSLDKIVAFVGGHRTGKTTLMLQIARDYISQGKISLDQIIFIDFSELDNRRIDLLELYRHYADRKPFFILDEIQELPDFEDIVLFLHNRGCPIFLSGSNSHMLSSDIATKLRGRVLEIRNTVLSFREYLRFLGKESLTPGVAMDVDFDSYLLWGGYPEIVLAENTETKRSILQSYLDVIIYRDIVDRYRIRNHEILSLFIRSLIQSHTKNINIHKLYLTYKTLGYNLSKNTLYEYMGYLENNFFVTRLLPLYKKSYAQKIYRIDNAYMNLYDESPNFGQKFEATIISQIMKKTPNIGFIEDPREVDVSDGDTHWQICRELTEQNMERELWFPEKGHKHLITQKYSKYPIPKNIIHETYDTFLLG